MDVSDIRLLHVAPGEEIDVINGSLNSVAFDEHPLYDAVVYEGGRATEKTIAIELDSLQTEIDHGLGSALRSLRLVDSRRALWIKDLCIADEDKLDEAQKITLEGKAVQDAQKVVFWAGNHDEADDILRKFLGQGSEETTRVAFSLAQDLANSDPLSLAWLVNSRRSKNFPDWCHLARILYRPWYQKSCKDERKGNPNNALVLCGNASILLSVLHSAAERIIQLEPAPRVLHSLTNSSNYLNFQPSELEQWIKQRCAFGFSNTKLFARIYLMTKDTEGEQRDKWLTLLGIAGEEIDIEAIKPVLSDEVDTLRATEGKGDDGATLIPISFARPQFEGWIEPPLRLDDRKVFTHTPLKDKRNEMRVLRLLPHHGDPSALVQCGILHVKKVAARNQYSFVHNSAHGNQKIRSLILVNGRKFGVHKALEGYLRHIRDTETEKLLFVWEICMHPGTPNLRDPTQLQKFIHANNFFRDNASIVLSMVLDLYRLSEDKIEELIANTPTENRMDDIKDKSASQFEHTPGFVNTKPGHSKVTSYGYFPLDRMADEIRILNIEPHKGDESSPMVCSLLHVPLAAKQDYHALSYTWGSGAKTKSITLSGQSFAVSETLYSALIHLRQSNLRRAIWVDAICINQNEIPERNSQISRMARIYTASDGTVIWLGDEAEGSKIAMEEMGRIAMEHIRKNHRAELDVVEAHEDMAKVKDGTVAIIYKSLREDFYGPHLKVDDDFTPEEAPVWRAICRLLLRPWFRRTWVIQEAVTAGNLMVTCGESMMYWEALPMFSTTIQNDWNFFRLLSDDEQQKKDFAYYDPDVQFARVGVFRNLRTTRQRGESISYLSLLIATRDTESTDPRDKIYGLWGLASDAADLVPTPDYAQSVQSVYTSFVIAWIKKYKRLDIICAAQPRTKEGVEGLPFWVPDWSALWCAYPYISRHPALFTDTERDNLEEKPIYRASGSLQPFLAYSRMQGTGEIHILVAAGLSSDTIAQVGDINRAIPGRPLPDWREMLWAVKETLSTHEEYMDLIDRWWRTMIAGREPPGTPAPDNLLFLASIFATSDDPSKPDNPGAAMFKAHVSNMLRQRRFFITKKGYFGLAHQEVEVGDEVCVLVGCSVPVVLRFHERGQYLFLGDAYVQGWMNGEMLEGAGGEAEVEKAVTKEIVQAWCDGPTELPPRGEGKVVQPFLLR